MFKGPSAFAIMSRRFPLSRYFEQFPKTIEKPFLPVLYGFFGKSWKGIDEYCDRFADRPHLLEFHLCFRKMRHDKYFKNSMRKIHTHMEQTKNPNTRIIISPILEAGNDISDAELKHVIKLCRSIHKYPIAISSLRHGVTVGRFQEVHGANPGFTVPNNRKIYNPDGTSVQFGQKENIKNKMTHVQWLANTHKHKPYASAIWCAEAQGLQNTNNSAHAPPPKQRDYVISDCVIDGMREYLK